MRKIPNREPDFEIIGCRFWIKECTVSRDGDDEFGEILYVNNKTNELHVGGRARGNRFAEMSIHEAYRDWLAEQILLGNDAKKERILLIDDCRNLKADVIARNYEEGIRQLEFNGYWDVLLLDHDLASFNNDKEYTGYDVMCWLEANTEFLPGRIECVSSNPVGRQRIQQVIDKLYKEQR